MKQLVAAVLTLTAIVAGIVVATSLSSSAQDNDDTGDTTTTTTVPADPGFAGRFGFRFDGGLAPEFDELTSCLSDQGIDIPEDPDRSFMFELRGEDIEGLAEALEACGLPSFGDRFPEGFPFDGEFPEGFPFHGEFPEGFPFHGDSFGFDMGPLGVDRDELASCLAELGSFDSVEQVRGQLDECLPAPPELDDLGGLEGIHRHGHGGFGFPFGGDGPFGFDIDPAEPELEGTST